MTTNPEEKQVTEYKEVKENDGVYRAINHCAFDIGAVGGDKTVEVIYDITSEGDIYIKEIIKDE